jgi:multicomponent Na+:H+ antiporter subunit E
MTGYGGSANALLTRPATVRAIFFFAIWVVVAGDGPVDLAPGIVAALAATWASLRLLPPGGNHLQISALARFALRFLGQSVVAGADVARRALDPRLPLNPGFVRYPVGLPAGPGRNAFTTLTSLLPGTVPVGQDRTGALVIHCLDAKQPVAAQLAVEEAMLVRVIGAAPGDG